MGNRQSTPQDQNNQQSDSINDNDTTNPITTNTTTSAGGGRAVRPTSRVQTQRETLRSAVIPVNANQRRAERRARRERVREQQQQGTPETPSLFSSVAEAMTAAAALRQQQGTELNASPFSRMIASVISEAVLTSFRDGQIPTASTTTTTNSTITSTPDNPGEEANRNSRQQLTMHLSPELFQQLEPGVAENSFMRFMRLPVIVTNVSTSDEAEEESEVTRVIMLPVFLYGVRSMQAPTNAEPDGQQVQATTEEETPTRRRSARIRERNQQTNTNNNNSNNNGGERSINGQWTVYIISGPNVDGIMNDSPSYEELLDLAALIGPARLATVSQEAIDSHVPIVKYEQVKQSIIGNSEGCQICLSSYQSQDNLRILACQHGFHDDCICKWLITGKNQCPLCRDVPIPTTATEGTPP